MKMNQADIACTVEALGECQAKIVELRIHEARAKCLKALLIAACPEGSESEDVFMEGESFQVKILPRKLERTIRSMARVCKLMGGRRFLQLCKMNLATIDSELNAEQRKQVLRESRTGTRTVEVTAKLHGAS